MVVIAPASSIVLCLFLSLLAVLPQTQQSNRYRGEGSRATPDNRGCFNLLKKSIEFQHLARRIENLCVKRRRAKMTR